MQKISVMLIAMLPGTLLTAQASKPLATPASPGQAIQDSAQASVHDLAHKLAPGIEILTDTRGVNFGPYLLDVMARVRKNWYELIPAYAADTKGKLAIEFKIRPDGGVADMKLVASAGNVALDRAAWGSIAASNPFPKLPREFTGPCLALRFRFYYNPDKADLGGSSGAAAGPVIRAVLAKSIEDSGLPKYPKKALDDKVEGMVRLEAQIAVDGTVHDVATVEGPLLLAEAASSAIQKWTFQPARKAGHSVEDRVHINVVFRLDGEQVRAQVVWPEVQPARSPKP